MDEKLKKALDDIRKLAKGDDLHRIEDLMRSFDNAISTGDKTAREVSKEAFELEKKYIPQLHANNFISRKLECKNMIMTVGFQKEPIILSIICMKPQKVILLHTEGSRHIAQEVEDDPDVKVMNISIIPLFITEYNASENYRVIKEQALTRVSEDEVTVIDPTAGRKVMVASLALFAFYRRYPMVYVHSAEQNGIVFPFTERLRFIENPFDYFGDEELTLVAEQFNCHLYEAALSICEKLEQRVRDPKTHSRIINLQKLIRVYLDWDSFLHSSVPENRRSIPLLSEQLKGVIKDFHRLGFEGCLPENVDKNLDFLKKLDDSWRCKKNIVDEFRLVDIFASALRRENQKKYDDAVGRLYRCLEMCATIRLMTLGLEDTVKPDYEAFSSRIKKNIDWLREEYRKRKHRDQLPDRIALDDQMTLLDIAGDNVAKIYESMKKQDDIPDSLMDIRNRSILAHGTNPIPEYILTRTGEEVRVMDIFKGKTEVIIGNTIGKKRFQELLAMATHGQIRIRD